MWSTFEDIPPFSRAGASPLGTEEDVDDEVDEVDKDEEEDDEDEDEEDEEEEEEEEEEEDDATPPLLVVDPGVPEDLSVEPPLAGKGTSGGILIG